MRFSTTPGTTSCSRPLYSPSVFSLIVTTSTSGYGVLTPFIDLQGLTFAYNYNLFLNVTFIDLYPFPIGVSKGPFIKYIFIPLSAYFNALTYLRVSSVIKSPYSVTLFL